MGSTVRRKWQVICVWARSFKELSKRSLGLIIFTLLLDSEKVDTSIGKSKVKESLLSQGVGMGALYASLHWLGKIPVCDNSFPAKAVFE